MTAYVISTQYSSRVSVGLLDSVHFTSLGRIDVAGNDIALFGTGNNVILVEGAATSQFGFGIALNAGYNNVTVADGGLVTGIAVNGPRTTLVSYGDIISETGTGVTLIGVANNITLGLGSETGGVSYGVITGGATQFRNSGTIYGGLGGGVVFLDGLNDISNSGGISDGVRILAGGASTIVNNASATITSFVQDNHNIDISSGAVVSMSSIALTNLGSIIGVIDVGGPGASLIMRNAGTVTGLVDGGEERDTVTNEGLIHSSTTFRDGFQVAVRLGGGDDFFDGRTGNQFGMVDGGTGNDTLWGGTGGDHLFGGDGDDHLSGGPNIDRLNGGDGYDFADYVLAQRAVTASLANPSANAGDAAEDIYISIEGITGSNFRDTLIGDANDNTILGLGDNDAISGGDGGDVLFGQGGVDVIFGDAGNDLIAGGVGADVVRGGLGSDLFSFSLGDQGDLILNFNEGGSRDGIDLRPFFDATGFAGTDPRGAGIMQVLQNGADTDVFLYGVFYFRIQGVTAAAIDDTYFLLQ
jgi:Ca2+-binding RTX toxin-like protein